MRKLLALLVIILAAGLVFTPVNQAVAQSRGGDLSSSLQRLQNNPRYQGRIIGTQIRRNERGDALYEVQILRADDRVIVVYIDPATGGVVGDSERRGGGGNPSRLRGRGNK